MNLHALEEKLTATRLQAIEELASAPEGIETPSKDGLARLALLHTALMAVRDAISAQQPRLGSGGEEPLD